MWPQGTKAQAGARSKQMQHVFAAAPVGGASSEAASSVLVFFWQSCWSSAFSSRRFLAYSEKFLMDVRYHKTGQKILATLLENCAKGLQ